MICKMQGIPWHEKGCIHESYYHWFSEQREKKRGRGYKGNEKECMLMCSQANALLTSDVSPKFSIPTQKPTSLSDSHAHTWRTEFILLSAALQLLSSKVSHNACSFISLWEELWKRKLLGCATERYFKIFVSSCLFQRTQRNLDIFD